MNNHYFKVVFIPDLNEVEAIPHQWEKCGTLFWPRTKKDRSLQSVVTSAPDETTWIKYKNCTIKAEGILLYSHATATADKFCIESTDDECANSTARTSKPPEKYYDKFFDKSTGTKKKARKSSVEVSEGTKKSKTKPSPVAVKKSKIMENTQENIMNISSSSNNSSDITELTEPTLTETLMANEEGNDDFSEIEPDQGIMGSQLVELVSNTKFNAFLEKFQQHEDKTELSLIQINMKLDNLDKQLKRMKKSEVPDLADIDISQLSLPINDKENLQKLEEKLIDEDFKRKMTSHFKRVVGTGSTWKTAAYRLCAAMFTKSLLTQFTWTGASRGLENKGKFSAFSNVLDIFYEVVLYADNSFNHIHKEEFFKDGVLKYSKSRLMGKNKTKVNPNKENQVTGADENILTGNDDVEKENHSHL